MKELTIYHFADAHFDAKNQDVVLESLYAIYAKGRNDADLWVIAGDLFNGAVQNSEKSGFPKLVWLIRQMMDVAPVAAVRGTPVHDVEGCYEIFGNIEALYPFVLLNPNAAYYLNADHKEVEALTPDKNIVDKASLLIFGLPEPSKEWFLAGREGLGREEANLAVVDELREILIGWGVIRKGVPEVPCLMVYHGAVAGAHMSPNQVQRPGEIALGRDDLASVGADYYALGHFHEAQQIKELPAFYAGSCRYGDNDQWCEADRKGFNRVIMRKASPINYRIDLERIHFDHLPPRKKVVHSLGLPYSSEWVKEHQVWLERTAVKDRAHEFNENEELHVLLQAGALPGSRVTLKVESVQTVRASEIQGAQHLRDKLQIWAHDSAIELKPILLEHADELEREAREQGVIFQPMDIVINRLRLRGATGILKGQGIDEVGIDLDQFEDGLIALVGENGMGKTTLIENMHPFSQLLTRRGKLQDHFRLRDGFRDLFMTDRISRKKFRALISVDGANPSGSCSYYLYEEPRPLTNGRKEDYDEKVGKLFGTADIFKRSAFVGQKANKQNPPLSDMTKGEKKELFATLAGLEPIQFASKTAAEWAKEVEAEIAAQLLEVEVLEKMLAGASEKVDSLEEKIKENDQAKWKLGEAEAKLKKLEQNEQTLRESADANKKLIEKIDELVAHRNDLLRERHDLESKKQEYREALDHKKSAEEALNEIESKRSEERRLIHEKSKIQEKREQLYAEFIDRKNTMAAVEKKMYDKKNKVVSEIAAAGARLASVRSSIEQIKRFLEQTIECPKCGHQFVPGSEKRGQELEDYQQQLPDLERKILILQESSDSISEEIRKLPWPEEPELPNLGDIEERIQLLKNEIFGLDPEHQQEILSQAQQAAGRIVEINNRIDIIDKEKTTSHSNAEELKKKLDPGCQEKWHDAFLQLEAAKEIYRTKRDDVVAQEATIKTLQREIHDLQDKAGELVRMKTELKDRRDQAADWRLLERAFGPDGVQALELDAMSPEIQQSANRLLAVAREANPSTPFDWLRVETTRIGGRGSDRRQIEDFLIWCHDTRDDTVTELSMISGGEDVWVREALYEAFAVRRAKTTGLKFSTGLADEADGALDPQARLAYFRMLEAAHRDSGRRHTIIITQSEAARDKIPQQIRLEDLVIGGKK